MISGKTKTLLLVEDDILIAMSEQKDLEDYGYKVILAHSGEEAIETFHTNLNIDLIVMDINLGKGIDGTETAKIILQEKDIPILFMSSHIENEIVEKTENITSYGYVVKNSSITVLDASIKMAFKLFDTKMQLESQTKNLYKSEKQTKFEKEKLENIFNAIEDGVYIVDKKFNIEYINRHLLKDFGEYKGEKCYEYFHNRNDVCPWCKNDEVFDGKSAHWEFYFTISQKHYDIIDTPLQNPDGSISKLELLRDITDQKAIENIIKEKQKLNTTLLNSMPYPIMLINKSRKIIAANKLALDIGVIINDY